MPYDEVIWHYADQPHRLKDMAETLPRTACAHSPGRIFCHLEFLNLVAEGIVEMEFVAASHQCSIEVYYNQSNVQHFEPIRQ
jgi:hypothetical protein